MGRKVSRVSHLISSQVSASERTTVCPSLLFVQGAAALVVRDTQDLDLQAAGDFPSHAAWSRLTSTKGTHRRPLKTLSHSTSTDHVRRTRSPCTPGVQPRIVSVDVPPPWRPCEAFLPRRDETRRDETRRDELGADHRSPGRSLANCEWEHAQVSDTHTSWWSTNEKPSVRP